MTRFPLAGRASRGRPLDRKAFVGARQSLRRRVVRVKNSELLEGTLGISVATSKPRSHQAASPIDAGDRLGAGKVPRGRFDRSGLSAAQTRRPPRQAGVLGRGGCGSCGMPRRWCRGRWGAVAVLASRAVRRHLQGVAAHATPATPPLPRAQCVLTGCLADFGALRERRTVA